jgi:hypothetical protein
VIATSCPSALSFNPLPPMPVAWPEQASSRLIPGASFDLVNLSLQLIEVTQYDPRSWAKIGFRRAIHPDAVHLFPGEEVSLKIFRKILDLVTFFSQNERVSGWFSGSNGESIPSQVRIFLESALFEAGLEGVFPLDRGRKSRDDNLNENSFKICLHFLDLGPFLPHKRLLNRAIRYLGEWSQNGCWLVGAL